MREIWWDFAFRKERFGMKKRFTEAQFAFALRQADGGRGRDTFVTKAVFAGRLNRFVLVELFGTDL